MKFKSWLIAHWFIASLVVLLVLSVTLRFYQLAAVPHGMTWDEAAIGYDGFAVWTAHRDEWLRFMPISFKSFGDYKAPLAIYVTGLFEMIFGTSLWVVRLPFALSGVVGVLGMVLLTRQLLKRLTRLENPSLDLYALAAGFGLTLSPWHLHLTRIGMESGMALTLVIWGVYCLLKSFDSAPGFNCRLTKFVPILKTTWFWLFSSSVLLVMSLYVYHSTKLATPLFVLLMAVLLRRPLISKIRTVTTAIVVGGALLLPLAYDTLKGHGSERLSQALIPTAGKTGLQIGWQLLNNLAVHFSPAFLAGGQTPVLRHGDGQWGVLLWPVFGLAVVGLVLLGYFSVIRTRRPRLFNLACFSLIWILIGYVPAVIGWEVPHANRTLLALPGWIWLAIIGWDGLLAAAQNVSWTAALRGSHGETNLLPKAITGLIVLSCGLFFIAYQRHYYTVFAAQSAADFQDGYQQVFEYLEPYFYDRPWAPKVNKIIMSNEYGQPYIFALYKYRISPIAYGQGVLNKFEFDDPKFITPGSLYTPMTAIVATASDNMPWERANKLIYGSDGSLRFGIFINASDH